MFIRNINPYLKNVSIKNFKLFKNKPYIKFTSNSINLYNNNTSKLDFLLSYNNLPIDLVNENGFPTRLRRYANYNVKINENNEYNIYYTNEDKFKQEVNDYRKEERKFSLMESKYIKDDIILKLITQSVTMALINNEKLINEMNVSIHQVRQICYPNVESHNSPEGIHKDGADYIISALIMNRVNIKGGNSIIYDENKNKIYKTTLYNDEGIFQDDKNFWHYVTPIKCKENYIGYRDILGIDIKIIS